VSIFDQYIAISQKRWTIGTTLIWRLTGTRRPMHSIECCYFQWPWVTLTTRNHPIFHIFVSPFLSSRDRNCMNIIDGPGQRVKKYCGKRFTRNNKACIQYMRHSHVPFIEYCGRPHCRALSLVMNKSSDNIHKFGVSHISAGATQDLLGLTIDRDSIGSRHVTIYRI